MDADTWLAYYLFVNHGILPSTVESMGEREIALSIAMAQREIRSRSKQ